MLKDSKVQEELLEAREALRQKDKDLRKAREENKLLIEHIKELKESHEGNIIFSKYNP